MFLISLSAQKDMEGTRTVEMCFATLLAQYCNKITKRDGMFDMEENSSFNFPKTAEAYPTFT